jgi:hypothetical protein
MPSFLPQGGGPWGKLPFTEKKTNNDCDPGSSDELDSGVSLTNEQRRAAEQEAIMIVSGTGVVSSASLCNSNPSTARPWVRSSRQNYNVR